MWVLDGLDGLLSFVRATVFHILPLGFPTDTKRWHHGDGSSPAVAIMPCVIKLSNSLLTFRYAMGMTLRVLKKMDRALSSERVRRLPL